LKTNEVIRKWWKGKGTLDVADPNQNISDNVTSNIGKEILDVSDPNQNIPDNVTPNIEISKHLQNDDLETLNRELPDQKNSKKITAPLNPPKRQRKQVASKNTDFLWI
jgi:hypothetical protein